MVIHKNNMIEAAAWAHECVTKIQDDGIFIYKKVSRRDRGSDVLDIEYWDHLPRWINIGEDRMIHMDQNNQSNIIIKMPIPNKVTIHEEDYEDWLKIIKKK